MRFGVVKFPGSNGDEDMIHVLRSFLGQEAISLWHKDTDLKNVDAIVLYGGTFYKDSSQADVVAGFSPIMKSVVDFANKGGFVLGVDDGFQMLCKSGLLPGELHENGSKRYICKNVFIKASNKNTSLSSLAGNKVLQIPVAHSNGRYFAEKETLKDMQLNNQIVFRYCDKDGNITIVENPNGSIENIAGVCNENRNVFGFVPRIECAVDPDLGNTDGRIILESIIKTAVI